MDHADYLPPDPVDDEQRFWQAVIAIGAIIAALLLAGFALAAIRFAAS